MKPTPVKFSSPPTVPAYGMVTPSPNKMHKTMNRTRLIIWGGILMTAWCIAQVEPAFAQLKTYPNGRHDSWQYIGIGGGGAMFYPAINPFQSNNIFVACDMGGGYVTHNGGASWRMFNLRGQIQGYIFDPSDSNTVYANALALFKSSDRGNTWSMIYPAANELNEIVSKGDHGDEVLFLKDSSVRKITALAIDPLNNRRLFAGISINKSVGLYGSEDGGNHWQLLQQTPDGIQKIFIHPASNEADRKIYLVGEHSITTCTKGGYTTVDGPAENSILTDFSGGFDRQKKQVVLYGIARNKGGKNTVYSTFDGGKTWRNISDALASFADQFAPAPEFRTLAASEGNPNTLYISYQQLTTKNKTILFGVAKSTDYGKSWLLVWKDKNVRGVVTPTSNFSKDWVNDRYGATWGENPLSIGVSPTNADMVIGTDFGRTISSANGGKTWQQVYSKQLQNSWSSTGLEVTTGYTLAFNPFNKKQVFLANTDIGLLESNDGGRSFISATKDKGIPERWTNTCYWMVFDPQVPGKAWTVMSGVHDLPRPKMFRKNGVKDYAGGILMTENSGRSWVNQSKQIGEAAFTFIMIDASSSKQNRTLYACAFGKGVYKSVDGGKTWQLKNKGLMGDEPFAWQLYRREKDGVLFLILSRRSEDGSIGNALDGALYRSDDGAENWSQVQLPPGTNAPTSLVVGNTTGELVMAAWGVKSSGAFTADKGGGIFKSVDEGKSWQPVLQQNQHISDITFDPRNQRYYACGFDRAAYYSEDGANTWTRINGFNFKWGKRVEFDPTDAEKIFIITFGGGVWYGPAKGDPAAVEDILNLPK
jgi:photosystem II stability/assembly factor-like uncharacterized protein